MKVLLSYVALTLYRLKIGYPDEDQERYIEANSLLSSGRQILSAYWENGQNLVRIFPNARYSQLQCSEWYA